MVSREIGNQRNIHYSIPEMPSHNHMHLFALNSSLCAHWHTSHEGKFTIQLSSPCRADVYWIHRPYCKKLNNTFMVSGLTSKACFLWKGTFKLHSIPLANPNSDAQILISLNILPSSSPKILLILPYSPRGTHIPFHKVSSHFPSTLMF